MAPIVYRIPPLRIRKAVAESMAARSGFHATTITQPSARYKARSTRSSRCGQCNLKRAPTNADAQIKLVIQKLHFSGSMRVVNGVYVPAIRRKIAAWSTRRSISRRGVLPERLYAAEQQSMAIRQAE